MSVSVVPFIPDTAPFTVEQRAWLNGYLAALFRPTAAAPNGTLPFPVEAPSAVQTVTILYGSQTGTAEGVAKEVVDHAEAKGLQAAVCEMSDYDPAQLGTEAHVLIVCSTYATAICPTTPRRSGTTCAARKHQG